MVNRSYARSDRISEQIKRELAELIQSELKDPAVGMLTITEVQVTPDLLHAKIYFTSPTNDPLIMQGLDRSTEYLRAQLSKRMATRGIPQLHFVYDTSIDEGMKISQLIKDALPPQ